MPLNVAFIAERDEIYEFSRTIFGEGNEMVPACFFLFGFPADYTNISLLLLYNSLRFRMTRWALCA